MRVTLVKPDVIPEPFRLNSKLRRLEDFASFLAGRI